MRRVFNGSERVALYLSAHGKCALCGVALEPGWHADHIEPFAAGGPTDVINGQALCPRCNLEKGGTVGGVRPWPDTAHLRDWQKEAERRYLACNETDFLCVATPGAGKTTFALRIAHDRLRFEAVQRIVVVCPTDHLRSQWEQAADRVFIRLDPRWSNDQGVEAADYHGIVVTYQQVASNPDIFRLNCKRPTLVIFDEIHHAGDNLSWGNALRYAFESAEYRLALSGTPFRSDNTPIPFVVYENGKSRADFVYGYADAMADDVCRSVLFPSYEGNMEWLSRGEFFQATFRDQLADEQRAQRLNTALSCRGNWIPEVLRDANEKLSEVRAEGHPAAGGLVIARDQDHARDIAKLLARLTKEEPTVAVSDEPDSSKKISRFAKSTARWIVAVKMVSEGVDIPRLRVGVYATNVTTELFVRQVVGRFVRVIEGIEDQSAFLFIPRDPLLVEVVRQIKEERDHHLEEERKRLERETQLALSLGDRVPGTFVPGDSNGVADDVIYDGFVIGREECARARDYARQAGIAESVPAGKLALFLRAAGLAAGAPAVAQPSRVEAQPTLHDRKATLRRLHNQLVHKFHLTSGTEHAEINRRLVAKTGKPIAQATEEELHARISALNDWLTEAMGT